MRVTMAYLERVARDWQQAYQAAHKKPAPAITWEGGWFRIESPSRPRCRRAKIEQMTATLRNFTQPE